MSCWRKNVKHIHCENCVSIRFHNLHSKLKYIHILCICLLVVLKRSVLHLLQQIFIHSAEKLKTQGSSAEGQLKCFRPFHIISPIMVSRFKWLLQLTLCQTCKSVAIHTNQFIWKIPWVKVRVRVHIASREFIYIKMKLYPSWKTALFIL